MPVYFKNVNAPPNVNVNANVNANVNVKWQLSVSVQVCIQPLRQSNHCTIHVLKCYFASCMQPCKDYTIAATNNHT